MNIFLTCCSSILENHMEMLVVRDAILETLFFPLTLFLFFRDAFRCWYEVQKFFYMFIYLVSQDIRKSLSNVWEELSQHENGKSETWLNNMNKKNAQSSRPEVCCKKVVLINLAKFTGILLNFELHLFT